MLELGRQGENLARTVRINVSRWYEEYGNDITISLLVHRPNETTDYYPEITISNGILNWKVTTFDSTNSGFGSAQIIITNNEGLIAKSEKYKTFVSASMS